MIAKETDQCFKCGNSPTTEGHQTHLNFMAVKSAPHNLCAVQEDLLKQKGNKPLLILKNNSPEKQPQRLYNNCKECGAKTSLVRAVRLHHETPILSFLAICQKKQDILIKP